MKTRWGLIAGAALVVAMSAPAALPLQGENGVFRLTVETMSAAPDYGSAHAAPGRQFLIVSTRWESIVDPKFAQTHGLATSYVVPDLAGHLFVGIDGKAVGTLKPELDDGTGRKSLGSLKLPHPGAKVIGSVVYEIPAGPFTSAELRFWDDTAGYIALSLAGATPPLKTVFPAQKNEFLETAIFGFDSPASDITAPPGFRALAVDLRARSIWTYDGEPSAYDVHVAPDSTVRRVNLASWTETHTYIHLLVDGLYAYAPDDRSTFPDTAQLVPEFFAGGRLIFLVPANAHSLELLCEMPHASAPGAGTLDLAPLHFVLSGTPPAGPDTNPLLTIKDDMFEVAIVGVQRPAAFAGEHPADGQQFVVLDVVVTNQGQTGEFFVPRDQLFALDADGSEVGIDDLADRGIHKPETKIHFPPGAIRRFEVLFRLSAAVAKPQLSFHGSSFMQAYDLPSTK